jgi:hypothetical protein
MLDARGLGGPEEKGDMEHFIPRSYRLRNGKDRKERGNKEYSGAIF